MQSEQLTDNNLHKEVVKQLEYYFSDSNLRNDYFIKKLIQKTGGSWLSVETLMKFNRLKSLVNNKQTVLILIMKTMSSDLIETNPNGDQIRRRPDRPVPEMDEQWKRIIDEKTVKLKGLPKDVTLDELIQWSKQFGSVLSVRMSRKSGKQFSGCASVIFTDKTVADKVAANQLALKFKDLELTKEIKGRSNAKQVSEEKVKNKTNEKMDTIFVLNGKSDKSVVKSEASVLQLKGLPRRLVLKEKKKKSRRIRDIFAKDGKVVYIGTDSSGNCLVQFKNQLALKKVLESQLFKQITADTKQTVYKLQFESREVSAQVLTGEEEQKFWIRANKRAEKCLKIKEKIKQKKELKAKTESMRKRSNSSVNQILDIKRISSQIA